MIKVSKAEEIINSVALQLPVREAEIEEAVGKFLWEPIRSDRDLPPFDRVMMDGIAIRYEQWEQGQKAFPVEALQKAGAPKRKLGDKRKCMEVMTGAILPENTDTVIRYEDIEIRKKNGRSVAHIHKAPAAIRQNIHARGTNRISGDLIVQKGAGISPAEIAVAATVGKSTLNVLQPPRTAVISTGDELVEIDAEPLPHQIRRSNAYMLSAALGELGVKAELFHLNDDRSEISEKLDDILDRFDLLILSGGVSKGKLDYIPEILEQKKVEQLFYKVRQRPGKPFWFGRSKRAVVFALPGNPVSTFSCYYRYIAPWLKKQTGNSKRNKIYARLTEDFTFEKNLTYFLQVKVGVSDKGIIEAAPVKGKGSSDLANLCRADGFLELPEDRDKFYAGEGYPLYLFRDIG